MSSIAFKDNYQTIHVFDNGYGELGLMIKGPRGGILGDGLLSVEDAKRLRDFLILWIKEPPYDPKTGL